MQQDTEEGRELVAARFPSLSMKQVAFAAEYVAAGGKGTLAAKRAGYAPASAHVEANRLLKNANVLKAIYELTINQLGAALPGALASVVKLSEKASSEYVRLEASRDLLDRAGMAAAKRVHVSGDVRVNFDFG